jgi:sugar phosphate isomerase/epimerase
MVELSIEYLSVFGLPPVRMVELAADLGCRHITTSLRRSGPYNPHGYPSFCLRDDAALRREMIAAMHERGVSPSSAEGIGIHANLDVRTAYPGDLEMLRELGVPRINVVSLDPDLERSFDQLGWLAEMAASCGIETELEFVPIFTIADLATAEAAVRHVGRADCRIMFDTMHFGRSAAPISDLAAVDPRLIGYVQLCDALRVAIIEDYMEEAVFERMVPGEGELPLLDMLTALPRDRVFGLEVPMRREAEAGIGPHERLGRCVKAARALLARLPPTARA